MMRVSGLKGKRVNVRQVNAFGQLAHMKENEARLRAEAAMKGGAALVEAATRNWKDFEKSARWYVARCRAGQEMRIAAELANAGIEAWCPVKDVRRKKRFGSGVAVYSVPVFHSYVFVRLMPVAEAWVGALMASRLVALVGRNGVPLPIANDIVNTLKLNVNRRPKNDEDLPIKVGDTARVIEGPFASFMATVKAVMGKRWRVKVDVDIFGRMTPVELEIDQLSRSA